MISLKFYIWLIFLLISYIYIEFFFSIILTTIFKNLKQLTISLTKKINFIFIKTNLQTLSLNLLFIFVISLKIKLLNIILPLIMIVIFINKFINRFSKNYNLLLNFNLIIVCSLFFFINNFVTFYLIIELYAILFYFFFLNINFNFKSLYLIQYKNSLLLYLFNNFLTSMLYLFGLSFLISSFGTINFTELKLLTNISLKWQLYLLVVSFILKMGFPGYHFLKIELYKYLDISIVIVFSVVTLYINYLLTIFFFNQEILYNILNSYKYITILLLLSIFFFIQKLKISNFQEFIAFSGFATNNLIVLNFII